MGKKRKKRSTVLARRIFLIWLAYVIACIVIPPLFHKEYSEKGIADEKRGTAQERVLCIDDNKEALLWRIRLIEEAQERIILCTFDFRDDNSGRDMMAALFHAADSGVEVRIMVDGINGMLYLAGNRLWR